MSRAAAGAPGVNLMPLLDVLLCTMGTLIVILGVINREARLHPAKRLHGKAAQEQEQMIEAREDLELRIEQLKGSKEKTLADLKTSRTKLAGIEDSKRKLEDQLQSLIDAVKKLPNNTASDNPQREKLRLELADLNSKRLQLEDDLKKARNGAAHRQPGYAVIPFDGMYKTSRRPIYIECRGDSVILQPEGIVFGPQDFLGPGGPSNPLASALRAAQEFWRNAPRPAPDMPNEPYPLLLVRPTGIIGYYLVRDAMSSWDAEFGYELVGEDWKLEYPNGPDAKLADMENRAVAESRQQLQWLAQVSPELFSRKSSKVEYHVSPFRGGVVRDGGPQLGNDPFAQDPLGGFGGSARSRNSAMPGMNGPGGGSGGFAGGLADAGGNSAFGTDPNARGSGGQGGLGNGQGGFGNGQSGFGNGKGGPGSVNSGLPGSPAGMAGGTGRLADGAATTGSGPDLGNGGSELSGSGLGSSGGMGGTNVGRNNGGSQFGTGGAGSSGNGGAEVANVGPRYAGAGNGTGGFGNGAGNFAGTPGGTGSGSQNLGSGNGNSSSGAMGAGNGNSSTPGDKTNSNGGANSFAGAPTSRGSIPGGAAGTPSEYGGVLLPNSAGGMMNSSAGSGTGSGMDGSQSGQYASGGGMSGSAGGFGNSSSPGAASAGGGASSSAGDASSGSPGGASSSIGSPSSNPNSPAGMPAMNFDFSPQQQQSAMYDDSTRQQQNSSASHSMSRSRGKNWALPTTHTSSVPVQRPIRVECWSDRLVLVPDTSDQQPQVIPLGQRTEDSLDPLVGAVRTYTKSWGIAGRGMYWKPQLVLNVNPNAEGRASDLQALLADSGWDVKKK